MLEAVGARRIVLRLVSNAEGLHEQDAYQDQVTVELEPVDVGSRTRRSVGEEG